MQRFLFIIIAFIITSSSLVKAQQFKKFTSDTTIFIEEMEDFMERNDVKKEAKELMEEFSLTWYSKVYSEEQINHIYDISNILLKKKARSYPHYKYYLQVLIEFANNTSKFNYYNDWETAFIHIISKKKTRLRDIQRFLNFTLNLLNSNTLYKSSSTEWRSNNPNYVLQFIDENIFIKFENLTLTCYAKGDSIKINNTTGLYDPINFIWKGNTGKIYWERAGLSKDSVYADLKKYTINMSKSLYEADSVEFYNKLFFDYPLIGKFEDKVKIIKSKKKATYPRFSSYNIQFEIKDIFENIDYFGGFSMRGAKFIGSGNETNDAFIRVYKDIEVEKNNQVYFEKKLFIQASSKFYIINTDNIIGKNAAVSLYLDTDSIYHPGLLFRYYDKSKEINLIRNDDPQTMSKSPYYNTFHKIDMDFELLNWKINENNINITMLKGSSINKAQFESFNYFRESRYTEMQGMDLIHPYVILRNYYRKYETKNFTGHELASYMKRSLTSVRQFLINLSYKGIVDYNTNSDKVVLKQRLFDYLDAIVGKKDYDVIVLSSTTNAPLNNAILNLINYDLLVSGVPEIQVSDSQNVVFYPSNQTITIKRNRNFDFAGVVDAGLFTFYGQNFTFKYDSFKVDLNHVDSMHIKIQSGTDNWGQRILANVGSVIEDVTGELLIDDPSNKSGVKNITKYPTFDSKKESFVYYDLPSIQKGVYNRKDFYFTIDPFKIDSLNDFSTKGMGYDGTFKSGIFPDFKEKLVLQKDNSLGFIRPTPETGFPVYKGKAHYYNDISLSHGGLKGDGVLKYLVSTSYSDKFIFFPDSTNATTSKFDITKKTTFAENPDVIGETVYIHFLPNNNEFFATNKADNMIMYANEASFNGTLLLEESGLTGWGKTQIKNTSFTSQLFTYKDYYFDSDTTKFNIKTDDLKDFTFKTKNVSSHVDFLKRTATLKANAEATKAYFPTNQYITFVEDITWEMDKKMLNMESEHLVHVIEQGVEKIIPLEQRGGVPVGSHYISVHPKQDSLNFIAPTSNFDIENNIIMAHKVKFIKVADATIFPGDGDVYIDPKAKMHTLKKAKIIANNDLKYHNFFDVMVNIRGAKDYNGSGYYNYLDENNRKQPIYFDLIAVDDSIETYAQGKVKQIADFTLSPYFAFFGTVKLLASQKYLNFNGYSKINHECSEIAKNWMKFENEINPNSIYIPVSDKPKDHNNNDLFSGIMMNTDSTHIFSTFLSKRKRYSDKTLISANGFIHFDNKSKKYIIASKEKIDDNSKTGNLLSIHRTFCNLYGQGEIDINAKLGQLKVQTFGNINHVIDKDQVKMDVIMTLDFFFDQPSMKIMVDTFANSPVVKGVNMSRETYTKGLSDMIGEEKAASLIRELSLFGSYKKFPKELEHTIFLTDLKLGWNQNTQSFQSTGQIGIGSMNHTQINKLVDGYVEIQRTRTGDSYGIYLELDKQNWYFFYYKRGLMQAYSSNSTFNNTVREIKASKRKMDVPRGEESYLYFLSNMRKKNEFIRRFTEDEEDSEEEINYDDEY